MSMYRKPADRDPEPSVPWWRRMSETAKAWAIAGFYTPLLGLWLDFNGPDAPLFAVVILSATALCFIVATALQVCAWAKGDRGR